MLKFSVIIIETFHCNGTVDKKLNIFYICNITRKNAKPQILLPPYTQITTSLFVEWEYNNNCVAVQNVFIYRDKIIYSSGIVYQKYNFIIYVLIKKYMII